MAELESAGKAKEQTQADAKEADLAIKEAKKALKNLTLMIKEAQASAESTSAASTSFSDGAIVAFKHLEALHVSGAAEPEAPVEMATVVESTPVVSPVKSAPDIDTQSPLVEEPAHDL